jgi:hypothetical protein
VPPRERGRTPAGFREQLLQRLRNGALRDGIPAHRVQQRIARDAPIPEAEARRQANPAGHSARSGVSRLPAIVSEGGPGRRQHRPDRGAQGHQAVLVRSHRCA